MRLSKNGFDTKNPNELVVPTALGNFVKPFTLLSGLLFGINLFLRFIPIQTAFIIMLGGDIGYLFLAHFINPRQLFFKLERWQEKT